MIVREALNDGVLGLSELVRDRAMFEARLLLSHVLNCDPIDLIVDDKKRIEASLAERYQNLIERRAKSEPVAYLTGKKEFFGHEFFVDPRVLIPRPETEELVEGVLRWIRAENRTGGRILDLGTGSGCIALSLAKELGENFEVEGLDFSEAALHVAEVNRQKLELTNATLTQGDIREKPRSMAPVDIIVSNPPYIPYSQRAQLDATILNYEPKEALFADEEGVEFYSLIFRNWRSLVRRPGLIAVETFDEKQREIILSRLSALFEDKVWTFGPHIFWELS